MRRCLELGQLQSMLDQRVARLRTLVSAMPTAATTERERLAAYVAIEGFNAWSTFVRQYCLSVMLGARTAGGTLASPSAGISPTIDHALQRVHSTVKPGKPLPTRLTHRDEPDWFDRQPLIVLSRVLGFSTQPGIARALSFPEKDFTDFRTIRNFYAHKGEATANKVRAMAGRNGLGKIARPSESMIAAPPVGGTALAERFLDVIRASASAMVT